MNKKRAAILFSCMLLSAFLVISWSSYQVARHSLFDEISESSLPLTSDNVYSEIQRDLLNPIFISSLMAHDTFVKDWVLSNETDPQAMIRYLREIDRRFNTVVSFFVSNNTHRYYDPQKISHTLLETSPEDKWFFDIRDEKDGDPYDIEIGVDPENRTRMDIFINYKVFDYSGNFIGVTGVGLPVQRVTQLIETYEQRYNRTIYLIDEDGDVMLHSKAFHRASNIHQQPGLQSLATQVLTSPGGSYRYSLNGENIFLNTRVIPEFGWKLMVEQNSGPHDRQLWLTLLKNTGISVTASIAMLLLIWLTIGTYQRRLELMATTDKLTGLMNRQAFEYIFRTLRMKQSAQQRTFSIILIDLDFFKKINDQYGHHIGDRVLVRTARLIQRAIRKTDSACRWGGEEFVLLLGDCSLHQAHRVAEKIRQAVHFALVSHRHQVINLTISCGVAESNPGESIDHLVQRADKALYQAKRQGRDQAVMAE